MLFPERLDDLIGKDNGVRVAFVAVAAMSMLGTDWMPNWILPDLVFGVPAFAILIVLARTYSAKQSSPEEEANAED